MVVVGKEKKYLLPGGVRDGGKPTEGGKGEED